MSHIYVSRPVQVATVLAVTGAVAAGVAVALPEIQRYLKVRAM